jgi:hypothetical protein
VLNFNFGHLLKLTAAFYSSATASPSTPISSGQGAAAAEVNACASKAFLSDLTGGTFFADISTVDTNCAILPLHPAQLSPPLNSSSREVSPVSSQCAQDISCGRAARRTDIWFDGFASCLCVLVILFICFNGIALNKVYSLGLPCFAAGLRIAKSVSPYATTIVAFLQEFQGGIDKRVSELRFSAGKFPSTTFALGICAQASAWHFRGPFSGETKLKKKKGQSQEQ